MTTEDHSGHFRSAAELEAALDHIGQSPSDNGMVELIVRRPATDQREVLEEGQLSLEEGLVGDNWQYIGSSRMEGNQPHPDMQINVMNARAAAAIAGPMERWPLAGDQLYVDLDLRAEVLVPGTRLCVGDAVIEVTAEPHKGCAKFAARFGREALRFVNSPSGLLMNLRGINARVVVPGTIRSKTLITRQ